MQSFDILQEPNAVFEAAAKRDRRRFAPEAWHSGHSGAGSEADLRSASNRRPHFLQEYSKIGIADSVFLEFFDEPEDEERETGH